MGIEPTAQAWEAWVLPLYDARLGPDSTPCDETRKSPGVKKGKAPCGALPIVEIAILESVELVVHGDLKRPADDAGEVLRRCIREVAARAGDGI